MLLLQREKKSWSKKRQDWHRGREREKEGKTTIPTTTTIRENERKIDENKTNDRKCFGEQQPEIAAKTKKKLCVHITYFKIVWSGFGQGTGHFFNSSVVFPYFRPFLCLILLIRIHIDIRICKRLQIPSCCILFFVLFLSPLCEYVNFFSRIDSSVSSRYIRQYHTYEKIK